MWMEDDNGGAEVILLQSTFCLFINRCIGLIYIDRIF